MNLLLEMFATGSITKRLGIEDGTVLKEPLIEYCLKDDKLGDPLISEEHILAFDWASKIEIDKVKKMILRINDFMIGMFRGVGIKLIDFKLEFGRVKIDGKNEIILADEPTGSLDMETAKDVFELLYKQKRSDRLIIFATHNRFFAKKADYLLEMRDGSIKSPNA